MDSTLVEIPGGRFAMGSERFYVEEAPVREIEVEGFAIERSPVTVSRFAEFVEATGYRTLAERDPDPAEYPGVDPAQLRAGSIVFRASDGPVPLDDPARWWSYVPGASWRHPEGPGSDVSDRAEHPVTQVAHADAEAFAAWAGMRLPSEAEWEYAARGGLSGKPFAWGEEERPGGRLMANYWQGEFPWRNRGAAGWHGTSPVGSFAANGFGLHDSTGNVWEWTGDYFVDPASASAKPCCGPGPRESRIPNRVIKGGSHLCAPSYCLRYRPAARQPMAVDSATTHVGFRCVRNS